MEIEKYFLVNQFCVSHEVEYAFIESLDQIGFIEIHQFENKDYIHLERLPILEKAIRLTQDLSLDINELEIILDLLEKIETLQEENKMLKSKIEMYRKIISD
jgi:hypothetical protein